MTLILNPSSWETKADRSLRLRSTRYIREKPSHEKEKKKKRILVIFKFYFI